MAASGHRHSASVSQNHKAQLANAYNELGKELSSQRIRVVGNYTLGKVIGEGTYGKVRLGVHRLTGYRVAIKQIPKAMSASLTREIHHHRQLHHPHVTQLYEVIATESNIWLVTELCSGGELFDYLAEKGRMEEAEARVMFGQLCLAVAYVHGKGIVHRDLKLENVLLDEHCRLKLGDFGFTREFERGSLLETFCGTTGYASPEMLMAKKYLGPEVDVWSLGVILYTLLTGTLPFDDDDEEVMKEKVIKGVFEDPEWLSDEARDLLKQILQVDPVTRPTIAQILAHVWFNGVARAPLHPAPSRTSLIGSRPASPPQLRPASPAGISQLPSTSTGTSACTFHSASSEFPHTPDNPGGNAEGHSESVLKSEIAFVEEVKASLSKGPPEDDADASADEGEEFPQHPIPSPIQTPARPSYTRNSSSSSKIPPAYPIRTPARTKRRSVSSTLSEPQTPTAERSAMPLPTQDFSVLLSTPAPLIFSTALERQLLNSMSSLGLDTGQIVHSVLTDACDATGALWWMLKRKAEKKAVEEGLTKSPSEVTETQGIKGEDSSEAEELRALDTKRDSSSDTPRATLTTTHSAPELLFVPPTPTVVSSSRPETPPRSRSPPSAMLSPTPSAAELGARSNPGTPAGSLSGSSSKGRKNRSGSVSIMQRATTALEAAGLVRKKSSEAVKQEQERSTDKEKRLTAGEESRSSHGSGSTGRLTKSPPLRAMTDPPVTPPSSTEGHVIGSPWVLTHAKSSSPPPEAGSPKDTLGALPNIAGSKLGNRNRASLLTAFRMWFKEDAKGKRKEEVVSPVPSRSAPVNLNIPAATPGAGRARPQVKRRPSDSKGGFTSAKKAQRAKRASVSSRRSSSVNSRRSSVHSTQVMMESPSDHIPGLSRRTSDSNRRRSFGNRTPNSEREEYISRPSSALSTQRAHRKSPSASSQASIYGRTASPLPKNHRRGGSGSSTRVVREGRPGPPAHFRSNSASSVHSRASSRQGSLYEFAETDSRRTNSPAKLHSRRTFEETPRRGHSGSSFVAHKRQGPFTNPGGTGYLNSIGRSSWKKSWGMEPPGWQTRSAHPAVEVIAIFPAPDMPSGSIRDVFTGRQSLSMGDESDWIDEDDDTPGYAGGLGQNTASVAASTSNSAYPIVESPIPMMSLPPKAFGRGTASRRTATTTAPSSSGTARAPRSKTGRSPAGRTSPLPNETTFEPADLRGGRRQLPNGRAGPAFKHPIQEEDEDEEE